MSNKHTIYELLEEAYKIELKKAKEEEENKLADKLKGIQQEFDRIQLKRSCNSR